MHVAAVISRKGGAGVWLMGGIVIQRAAYAHAATAGKGVQEYAPGSSPAGEMEALYGRLAKHFGSRPAGRAQQRAEV